MSKIKKKLLSKLQRKFPVMNIIDNSGDEETVDGITCSVVIDGYKITYVVGISNVNVVSIKKVIV